MIRSHSCAGDGIRSEKGTLPFSAKPVARPQDSVTRGRSLALSSVPASRLEDTWETQRALLGSPDWLSQLSA